MPFSLRPLARAFHSSAIPLSIGSRRLFVPRNFIPAAHMHTRHYTDFAKSIKGFINNVKASLFDENAVKNSHKLSAAYWSIGEEEKSLECYIDNDACHTFSNCFNLLQKRKDELTFKEVNELIEMYQTSIRLADPTTFNALNEKLKTCQTLLSQKK